MFTFEAVAVVEQCDDTPHAEVVARIEKVQYSSLRVQVLAGGKSNRVKVVATKRWVNDSERAKLADREFLLRREPDNPADRNAIAVFSHERKLGYVPAVEAHQLSPLLDKFATVDGFVVDGATQDDDNEMSFFVDLPELE
ncbi:hypothetical protein HII28_19815 [Planctomonas sp. JC2975]|nr:hypothetical protein [Planctomonas sp. JC2975]